MSWVRTLGESFFSSSPSPSLAPSSSCSPELAIALLLLVPWFLWCLCFVGSGVRRRGSGSCAGSHSALLWRMHFHDLSSLEIHPGQEGCASPHNKRTSSQHNISAAPHKFSNLARMLLLRHREIWLPVLCAGEETPKRAAQIPAQT
jgi:hypothetical protein